MTGYYQWGYNEGMAKKRRTTKAPFIVVGEYLRKNGKETRKKTTFQLVQGVPLSELKDGADLLALELRHKHRKKT